MSFEQQSVFEGAADWRIVAIDDTAPRSTPPLGVVDLWRIDLDAVGAGAASDLPIDEQNRAQRYVFSKDRVRFVAGRRAFRRIVSAYRLDLKGAAVCYAPNGKPQIEDGAMSISFSRTGGLAIAAVASGGRLGVDVEALTDSSDLSLTIATHFSHAERAAIEGASGFERLVHFYRAWTAKEALLKATGEGLSDVLSSISIDLAGVDDGASSDSISPMRLLAGPEGYEPDMWSLATVMADRKSLISIAQDSPIRRVRFFQYK